MVQALHGGILNPFVDFEIIFPDVPADVFEFRGKCQFEGSFSKELRYHWQCMETGVGGLITTQEISITESTIDTRISNRKGYELELIWKESIVAETFAGKIGAEFVALVSGSQQ